MTEDYPRPQLERNQWLSLDGAWDSSFDGCELSEQVVWTHEITVPFPPESKASGVHDGRFHTSVWYRRLFRVPDAWQGQRIQLHFGAVDLAGGDGVVVVHAEDDHADLSKLRAKQDWLTEPHGIWYPRTHLVPAHNGHLADGMA